ncbi:MAG: hypothetical protein K9M45_10075 [Kiritimatiellales bacterium]|nr:hypothetical protein [Kiritimatiellales bacterium]
MGYEIEKREGFFEIRLFGDVSKFEVLTALAQLVRRDPQKKYPDVWVTTPEVQVSLTEYPWIVKMIARIFIIRRPISKKTAIIASGDFQKAQFDLYRKEASVLPADIGVFRSRDEAIAWIKSPEPQPPPEATDKPAP